MSLPEAGSLIPVLPAADGFGEIEQEVSSGIFTEAASVGETPLEKFPRV
jgi:hypothetical protein